jgi:hypothetical protein
MRQLAKDAIEFDPNTVGVARQDRRHLRRKRFWQILLAVVVLVLVGLSLIWANWPFRRSKVIADLEDAMNGKVEIRKFRRTFFPHPGCVAEDVIFKSYGGLENAVPITIRKLTIEGGLREMFRKHVPRLRAEGVRLIAPSPGYLAGWRPSDSKLEVVVDEFIISDSVLEFSGQRQPAPGPERKTPSQEQETSLKFTISKLDLRNPGTNQPFRFEAALHNPTPPGDLRLNGFFGPWRSENTGETRLGGTYAFERANLGVFHGIAGTLSSQGSFTGMLQQVEVSGKTNTPDFEVTDTGHKIGLSTEFQARINTVNGDVALERVDARLGKSRIGVAGTVAGAKGEKGKTASLDMSVRAGRIEDFLFLFLDDRVAPMFGAFSFKGRVRLPPGKEPFTKRLELSGGFGIGDASLHNPVTQSKLEEFSERAEGEKDEPPERVVSDLKGRVVLRGGMATFSQTSFHVPGAIAHLHGTYSLLNYRIDLHGRLLTEATLPKATSGVKSFLLRVISPLLKKNHRGGGVVALSITGFYPQPVYKTAPVTHPI